MIYRLVSVDLSDFTNKNIYAFKLNCKTIVARGGRNSSLCGARTLPMEYAKNIVQ